MKLPITLSVDIPDREFVALVTKSVRPFVELILERISKMQQQIADVKAATDALLVKADELVNVNGTLVTLTNQLKQLLDAAIAGTLTAADAAALDSVNTELAQLQSKLQGVIQTDTDANVVDQPGN